MTPIVTHGGRVLALVAALFALLLAVGIPQDDGAVLLSDIVYPTVALGAGLLLVMGARGRQGRERRSWLFFGAGVLLFGFGESVWAWYELVIGVEPPFPGPPDIFYLAAYPVLAAAILLTPRLAANPFQRGQQLIDAVVITAGVSVLAWFTIFRPMYLDAGGANLLELAVGSAYPLGDVLVIVIAATVGVRRSSNRRDRALWLVVAALLLTAVGDIVYLIQTWSDGYVSGTWLDATWLAAYGLFALAASHLPDAPEAREPRQYRLPMWHVLIPVGVVLAVSTFSLVRKARLGEVTGLPLDIALTVLGLLVLARILLAVAEDHRLVDGERRQLISVVSHELCTPLTAVRGYLDLALADWGSLDDSEKREMVEISHDQARLVTRIVTDLIATSRDKLHATELSLGSVDAGRVVGEVVASLGIAPSTTVMTGTGVVVNADRERLAQVVTNLLTNADRYGRGAIICRVARHHAHVEIEVHDNGPGVPARYREAIWDRFERGPHRLDATTPGSGLGLAVVRSLVHAHSGQAGYRPSELLGGACFWFRLPAAPNEDVVRGEPEPSGLSTPRSR